MIELIYVLSLCALWGYAWAFVIDKGWELICEIDAAFHRVLARDFPSAYRGLD